ncbi:MAG TPA: 2-oxo-4-hydroxy-4-carboxy-5-ureidoimidazoline decarboxylase [Acidimicrobiales bacterium]|nr:2-oxo-4-hydroxy-4-carboxy-5-ureidoimidazoline decarboxylase [Acidimicrobiales bacterium]
MSLQRPRGTAGIPAVHGGEEVNRLGWFNELPEEQAAAELLAVCHSRRWAERVAAGRPYPDLAALERAADAVWTGLEPDDWREAFAAHPRIGEPEGSGGGGGGRSAGWSAEEQAGVGGAGEDVRVELARGNAEYERRFGHVYLVAAAGRGADEILADLRARLGNDPAAELAVAAEEHRRITRLRLGKLVGG